MALFSTLSLFVLRILADDPDNTFALNDLAFIANRLYRSSYFHNLLLSSFSAISLSVQAGLHARTNKNSCYEFFTAFALYHTAMSIANVFCILLDVFLFVSPNDSALCQVISGHFQGHLVPRQDSYEVLSELAADMSENNCSVFKFYAEKRIGKLFDHNTFEFNDICF